MVNESFVKRGNFRTKNFPETKNSKGPPQYSSKIFHTILSGFASKLLIAKYLNAEPDSFLLNSRS